MPNKEEEKDKEEEKNLVRQIENSKSSNQVVSTTLKTDERVIARVTDGIYRQPASALRELITNAYDADATRVVIKTDAPRFERILIEDNGLGMSPSALAHMLMHIGGSAKRQEAGRELGITDSENPLYSPSGRKLIGKIGIGIFSVAQLTHTFQIVTKTKGDNHRTIATVALKQYSDERMEVGKQQEEYESGKVNIWREKAKDINFSGTSIILTNIRPQARDTLRSKEIWAAIEQSENTTVIDEHQSIEPPKFHVGRVDSTGNLLKKSQGKPAVNVPWESSDPPDKAFKKLVQCVWDELQNSNPNPQLDKLFDYYLQMVWQLSLSIPLPYVNGHLFDMDLSGWAESFQISNEAKGSAKQLTLKSGNSIREILNLKEGDSPNKFEVLFDDLKLFRPIKFKGLPSAGHAIKRPLVFLGKCREEFKKYSHDLSGGPLEFEAYLFWTPKVAPAEHRGSLIRLNGASGTLFDSSFMRYQVSEQTRLRQITCEIFIHEGFDSALNIDRESFNYAHPHAVFLTRWLHSSLRQLATAQKRVAGEIREMSRDETKVERLNKIQQIALDVWKHETNDIDSTPPSIKIEDEKVQQKLLAEADITFNRSVIASKKGLRQTSTAKAQELILDEKLKAIVQVLASFGLLDNLSKSKQERLLKAIYQILETAE
jgi:hypothetical protein